MKRFRVDLKTFLGLAMPNQCYHVVTKLILGWFVGGIFRQETQNLIMIHIYSTTILYDMKNIQQLMAGCKCVALKVSKIWTCFRISY